MNVIMKYDKEGTLVTVGLKTNIKYKEGFKFQKALAKHIQDFIDNYKEAK